MRRRASPSLVAITCRTPRGADAGAVPAAAAPALPLSAAGGTHTRVPHLHAPLAAPPSRRAAPRLRAYSARRRSAPHGQSASQEEAARCARRSGGHALPAPLSSSPRAHESCAGIIRIKHASRAAAMQLRCRPLSLLSRCAGKVLHAGCQAMKAKGSARLLPRPLLGVLSRLTAPARVQRGACSRGSAALLSLSLSSSSALFARSLPSD